MTHRFMRGSLILCIFAFSLAFAMTLNNCGGVFKNVNLETPEQKYVAIRAELNIMLKQYVDMQDFISPENHKKVKKSFYDADMALDIWEQCLDIPDYDYSNQLQTWLEAKNIIMEVIRNGR